MRFFTSSQVFVSHNKAYKCRNQVQVQVQVQVNMHNWSPVGSGRCFYHYILYTHVSHSPRCASCREAQLEPMLTNASYASSEGSDTYLLARHSSRARASSGQASVPENPFDGLCSQSFGSQEPAPAPSPYVPCSLAHNAFADLSKMR